MKMSIDNSIRLIEKYHKWEKKCGFEGSSMDDATNKLIEVAKKYQKIEGKIKVLQQFTEDTPLATQRMIRIINEIGEVLEDGKSGN